MNRQAHIAFVDHILWLRLAPQAISCRKFRLRLAEANIFLQKRICDAFIDLQLPREIWSTTMQYICLQEDFFEQRLELIAP